MHAMAAFFPRDARSLSKEEWQKALRTLFFLKENCDKTIKSRTGIEGLPQREYIPKEEAS